MRKTVRKIMALVLMGVATFGLVACGSVEEKTGIETSGNDVMKMSGEKSQIHLTQTKETDEGFEVPDPKRQMEQLNLWDVTGDGKDEVILSSEPNMHVDWNLYEFTGKELKRIYSNVETAELERDAFRVELLDDYKMKITGVKFNYEQIISLLDLGCQKSELEYVDPNDLDRSDNQAARVYKEGKLGMTEEDTASALSLHALMAETWDNHYAEYDYFKERNDDKTIRTSLRITIGSKEIGKLNVYLKYDAETDSLVIGRAQFVGEK